MENSCFLKVCQDSPLFYGQEKDETLERTKSGKMGEFWGGLFMESWLLF